MDLIDIAKKEAMKLLGTEKRVNIISTPGIEKTTLVGLGWAVGKGYAIYHGDGDFLITFTGLSIAKEYNR
jgi:hypothetical protein